MKHFLGSVGVRGSVRGPFFTRHLLWTGCYCFAHFSGDLVGALVGKRIHDSITWQISQKHNQNHCRNCALK